MVSIVEKYKKLIADTHEFIWKNPETGFREEKTGQYMEEVFEKLGYELHKAGNIPGFYTVIDTGVPGPCVLVLAELDALVCRNHPDANPETGAVHCCGHSAQCATMAGIAATLKEPEVLSGLSGRIKLCLVPAEELIEIEYRESLREKGIIKYLGGKTEFLSRGYFDYVDVAFMIHSTRGKAFMARRGAVGCIAKRVVYKGVSSHAGGAPWLGCNALYAANLGLSAINAIRETFEEKDIIRVHPIITSGGTVVNAIPEKVVMESFVRGASFAGIKKANERVNRALCGAAVSMGANVEILDNPGYAPLDNAAGMKEVFEEAVKSLGFELDLSDEIHAGSTDMGDLSSVMPAFHPYAPGSVGTSHGDDYFVPDIGTSGVNSAAVQVKMIRLLLENGGERAKKIKEDFKPAFGSISEYLRYVDGFVSSGNCITYSDDGTVSVKYK